VREKVDATQASINGIMQDHMRLVLGFGVESELQYVFKWVWDVVCCERDSIIRVPLQFAAEELADTVIFALHGVLGFENFLAVICL
jgi:hypothetical protein